MSANNVVRIKDYLPPPPRPVQSQYKAYPLPFFSAEGRRTWAVTPTGNYREDCETGKVYAIEFLKSCDGTVGWSSLLSQIVADIIRAGPDGTWSDGGVRLNGVVVGFMSTIGKQLCMLASR